MKQLIDIRNILVDEDYTRLLQCKEMQKEIEDIDKQVEALTAHREELFLKRHILLVERTVLFVTLQAFDKQIKDEKL